MRQTTARTGRGRHVGRPATRRNDNGTGRSAVATRSRGARLDIIWNPITTPVRKPSRPKPRRPA